MLRIFEDVEISFKKESVTCSHLHTHTTKCHFQLSKGSFYWKREKQAKVSLTVEWVQVSAALWVNTLREPSTQQQTPLTKCCTSHLPSISVSVFFLLPLFCHLTLLFVFSKCVFTETLN